MRFSFDCILCAGQIRVFFVFFSVREGCLMSQEEMPKSKPVRHTNVSEKWKESPWKFLLFLIRMNKMCESQNKHIYAVWIMLLLPLALLLGVVLHLAVSTVACLKSFAFEMCGLDLQVLPRLFNFRHKILYVYC